ncbi:NAD-dependent succinate-semialdehyde dehydrogenase [Brucella gallinifaecis]|uniref:NAD-dependent succinate-semialdehyde dehydrogenase n=2 Tax=Brucella gallinifaecis TaxID=215590 RepID=A0A502BN94_9HYPH|nr:NAD-dependent succinate-semialdehyde dehydrogenase [Brucella gallinifaecis]
MSQIMQITYQQLLRNKCLVNGQWLGNAHNPVFNPATGEQIGETPSLDQADIIAAVEAAEAAFPSWSARLAKDRAKIMRRWSDLLLEHIDDLALILTSEQGKPIAEARGEIVASAAQIEFFGEEAKRIYGTTIPSHVEGAHVIVNRQPIGVCAAITPWNFPASMIARKVAPALAAGCTVVCKPAPDTPLIALALAFLALEAGVPAGVLNLVTGDAKLIGNILTSHPAIRLVSFTGSTDVGKLLMSQAASTVKKLSLELGGNAPFIVFDDADLDAAIQGALAVKYRNMGQTCVSANRLYIQSGIYDRFAEQLSERVAQFTVGNGIDTSVSQGPLVNAAAVSKVERHVQDALAKGANLVAGGKRHALGGNFFEPTVMTNISSDMLVCREETFGPLAALIRFESEEELISLANDSVSGLAAYFYTRDLGRALRLSDRLESGMIGVNSTQIVAETVPFGGVKQSGLGREGSHFGIEEVTEVKYILLGGLNAL